MYKLVDGKDPILKTKCRAITAYDNIEVLKQSLRNICEENSGIGLAANQIGSDLAVFYLNTNGPKWYINPELNYVENEEIFYGEGCLSFPGEILVTRRHTKIHISHDGGPDEMLTGLSAVAFLHELDHLQGITMHERKV